MGVWDWLSKAWQRATGSEGEEPNTQASDAAANEPILVRYRRSSLCMDADGVTGHEFYQESADGRTMERVRDNITAITYETLPKPALNRNLPQILCSVGFLKRSGVHDIN